MQNHVTAIPPAAKAKPGLAPWIFALTVVAWAARVALCFRGGQLFVGDEGRYLQGLNLYYALSQGRGAEARWLLSLPDHQLFIWLCALIAPLQHAAGSLFGWGDWTVQANIGHGLPLGAAVLSFASAALIPAIYILARRLGSSEFQAGWSAVFVAGSNTLFYMSRHFQPYDTAVLLWLCSLLLGDGTRRTGWFLAGLVGALNFFLYTGYWFLPPLTGAWVLRRQRALVPGLWWAAGSALGVSIPLAVGWWAGGPVYWHYLRWFSNSVKLGLFSEGWSLPWEYLWHTEGWAGAALLGLMATVLWIRRRAIPAYVVAALALFVGCYALMVFGSVGLERFVVYGRTCRPLVPLLAVVAAWGFATVLPERRPVQLAALGAVLLCTFPRLAENYVRVFPREIEARVVAEYGNPKRAVSFSGTLYSRMQAPVDRPDLALCNAVNLYPIRAYGGLPAGRTLLSFPHPLAFRPYQYEGHTPRERMELRAHDIAIKLIALDQPGDVPDFPRHEDLFGEDVRGDGYDKGRAQVLDGGRGATGP